MSSEGAGLSMYHISPQKVTGGGVFYPEPKISFRRGASLVSCQLGVAKGGRGRGHAWVRGEIENFSKGSRRRVLRLVASLKRSAVPLFCALTYPDLFEPNPRMWKKHLDSFFKRVLRKYPHAVIVWRLEPKRRKTGVNAGNIAPHFHFLAYNIPYYSFLGWLSGAWYEVVKSGDPKHFNAGTRVEPVRSVRGVLYYTSKYICKAENIPLPGWGRFWGVVNREELPKVQGEFEVVQLDERTALQVLRYMRRLGSMCYKRGRYIGRRKIPGWGAKYTLICDSEFWYKTLPKIASA